ncbi:MAG: SRPBCC family protein [Steroidobacteraceae bacterium]
MAQLHELTSRSHGPLAAGFGWLSVGLGLAALAAPRKMGEISGLEDRETLIRMVGLRELASGVGLLTQTRKAPWLWSRVVGDAIDLALLASAHNGTRRGRSRAIGAAAVVAAITAADVAASLRASQRAARLAPDIYIDRTIIVNKTPRECYDYWRDLRNIANFTNGLEKVIPLDERRSQWIMNVPGRGRLEWTAEVIEDKPGERLRWRTADEAPFNVAGAVNFEPAPGGRGTFVTLGMHCHAPGGAIGAALARFLGPDPFGEVRENLRRFKQLVEAGEIPTTTGQPSGRRSLLGRMLPEGRRSQQPGAGPRRSTRSSQPSQSMPQGGRAS